MSREPFFFEVPLSVFSPQAPLDFNLYVKKVDHFELMVEKGDFYPAHLEEFVATHSQTPSSLHLHFNDRTLYFSYAESCFEALYRNKEMPIQIKANIIYSAISSTIENLFATPHSKTIAQGVKALLDASLSFILANEASIKSLMRVGSYDYYTYTHSMDAGVYAMGFANYLRFSRQSIMEIGYAALMHDIGKSKVPVEITTKKGKLTPLEFEKMKLHPVFSHDLLVEYGETNENVLMAVLGHHEKKHGNGYPFGLRSHEIHDFAKIISIADIFSALTTRRSYKESHTSFEALQLMKQYMLQDIDSGLFFDFVRFIGDISKK